ncbi:MAG TPA: hypothetical protein VJR03_02960 [Nitrospira sp.]|nr:hypothetical protein [Nitrospira sp.]
MHRYLRCVLPGLIFLAVNPVLKSADIWRESPKPADSTYEASLIPTVEGTPVIVPSVRNLPSDGNRPRSQGLLATTTWLKDAFATETEVAVKQGSANRDDPSAHMMRVGVRGTTSGLRYGMTYQTADEAFSQTGGQDQKEAWGEWKNGTMAIRSTVGQRTRLDADAAGNRLEQKYNRIDLSWNSPAWPRLGVSYVHNAASNTMDALSLFPQRASHHRVEAAVGYSGAMWDAKLASGYGFETDVQQHAADSRVQTETLTASFRPIDIMTITPTVGYRLEQQPWSGVWINSPSASLSMNYKQSPWLSMTAMGNYFSMRSSDRLVDFDVIGGKGVLTWELEPVRDWKPQLTVEGGYNLQVNRLMPSSQTENLSGLLRLVFATM